MRLDAAKVLDVAARARIRLDAADAARLATELGRVLAWADGLLPVGPPESATGAPAPPSGVSPDPTAPGATAPVATSPSATAPGASAPTAAAPVGPLRADTPSRIHGPDLLAESAGRDGPFVRVPPVR